MAHKITLATHRLLSTVALVSILFCGTLVAVPVTADSEPRVYPAAPGGEPGRRTLVLYDTTREYGWLDESYAAMTGNLVSHRSSWSIRPARRYQGGELSGYTATVYIGSTEGEPLPPAFLEDVLATDRPVLWMSGNIERLADRNTDFASRFGWRPGALDTSMVSNVDYRGTASQRDRAAAAGGILRPEITAPALVTALGHAVRPDGSRFPWAVRSRQLTYLGEIPFSFTGPDGRYLAARRVRFSVGVYPRYRDPRGVHNNGRPVDRTLAYAPQVVDALRYLLMRRATLVMHGYTHQYGEIPNPYNGVSGDDYGGTYSQAFPFLVPAVRDGVASFFYHPYLGTAYLDQVVTGIQALGFRFVGPAEVRQG